MTRRAVACWALAAAGAVLIVAGIVNLMRALHAHAEVIRTVRDGGSAAVSFPTKAESLVGQGLWLAVAGVASAVVAVLVAWLVRPAARRAAVLTIVVLTVILPMGALQYGVSRTLHDRLADYRTHGVHAPHPAPVTP